MAERTIVTRLRAEVADFKRGMGEAAKSVDGVTKATDAAAKKSSAGMGSLAQSARDNDQAWRTVGASLTAFGAVAAVGVGVAVARFAEFDQAMSNVQASTMESAENMELLRAAALDAGARTAYSATEAAAAVEELAKAGVSTSDVLNGALDGALDLAAAGGMDVAAAAETAASAMTQFGLKGTDVTHIADLLAAGAGKAQGSVDDMGQALNQSGLVANQFGLSVEDTVGTLTAFAAAGMVGSDAGTSLRTMLLRLANPTDEVKDLLADLGIAAYDAAGEFVGIDALAGQLQTSMRDLTQAERDQALALIFGQDAIRASNILMREGEQGIRDWTEAVNQQGYAADVAAARMDNLAGDFEALGGSFETLMIGMGEGANGPLRSMVQGLDSVVDSLSKLPDWAQQGALALGGVTAATGLAAGGLLLAVPQAVEFYDALGKLGPAGAKAQGGIKKLGGALPAIGMAATGAVAVYSLARAVGEFADANGPAVAGIEATTAALLDLNDAADIQAVDRLFEDFGRTGVLFGDGVGNVRDFSSAVEEVLGQQNPIENFLSGVFQYDTEKSKSIEGIEMLGEGLAQLVRSGHADEAVQQFNTLAEAAGLQWSEIDRLQELMPAYNEALAAVGNEQELATAGAEGLTAAFDETGVAADEAEAELSDLAKSLQGVGEAFVDPLAIYTEQMQAMAQATADSTEDAEDSWADYVDGVSVSLSDYAAELETQTAAQEKWRENVVAISQRGGTEVAGILAAMGVEGARLTDEMANATGEDFERMKNALIEDARLGGEGAARELEIQMGVMAAVGASGGKTTAAAIAEQLGIGVDEVTRIAAEYGVELASGINPILTSLGRREIAFKRAHTSNGAYGFADGGFHEDHVAQIAPAGAWRVWAEDETGGESYIPLAPSKRPRSLDIWRETGRRLGAKFEEFANGGFSGVNDVPRPYSLGQYRPPISTPAQAGMEEMYSEVIAYIKENSLAAAGGDIVALGRRLAQMGFRISGHPSFGGVVAGGHRPGSLHYAGRAIDVNYGPGGQNAIETAAINALMPQLAGMRFAEKIWQAPGHYDHLHLAMKKGGILNPHIRDAGGPLRPGYTYNGTGANEMVVPAMKYATAAGYNPSAAAAAPVVELPPVYVENPFTGEYLLARVSTVAHREAVGAVRSSQERPRR